MNYVNYNKPVLDAEYYRAKDLMEDLRRSDRNSAFVGKCGIGPDDSLYLITFNNIVLADNPAKTWDGAAPVYVKKFVNIKIQIEE